MPSFRPEVSQGIVDAVTTSAGAAIHGIGDQPGAGPMLDAAQSAFSDATKVTAATAAGFLLIGLAASASLSNRRPDEQDQNRTHITPRVTAGSAH